ncbi:MAG: MgtC/SapB family protein [Clostridia bacterium]|nr:MgtC/SapB family protein [Clostridia bacterium]
MFYEIISSFAFTATVRLILGFFLTGIIGLERSSWNKPAGFRTHALVGISAVLVMLCGEYLSEKYAMDPSRIPAQLLSGIGFLGAGTILRNGANVKGLTTAASLLAVTCIGLIIGAGFYALGIVATIIVYFILSYSYILFSRLDHFSIFEIEITIKSDNNEVVKSIEKILSERAIKIKHISNNEVDDEVKNNEEYSEKTKVLKISGKYSNKDDNNMNEIISEVANLEDVIKVEEV